MTQEKTAGTQSDEHRHYFRQMQADNAGTTTMMSGPFAMFGGKTICKHLKT